MDDSQWLWPVSLLSDLEDALIFLSIMGAFGLRVLPATRRWAPRGNARSRRPRSVAQSNDHAGVVPPVETSSAAPAGRS